MELHRPCPICDKLISEPSYRSHKARYKRRMQDHTKHEGYETVKDLLNCKTEDDLRGTYKALSPDEKIAVYQCFDVFEKEKKALEKKLVDFGVFSKRTKKLNDKISKIPLRENETSRDLFGSENSSPRSVDDAVQPAATTSLLNRVLSVVSSKSSSSSSSSKPEKKKRKAGSTLFDSFDTFFSVLHFLNSFYTFYLLDTF